MIIDERKVNLAEKDIEQWLYENPDQIQIGRYSGTIKQWLKRQYEMPSGIADLIGITEEGWIAVVEVKNTAIDARALTQVCRYAADIESICETACARIGAPPPEGFVCKVIVGKSIDEKTMKEARALHISIVCFSIEVTLAAWPVEFTDEYRYESDKRIYDLSRDETWEAAATILADIYNRYIERQRRKPTPTPIIIDPTDAIATLAGRPSQEGATPCQSR